MNRLTCLPVPYYAVVHRQAAKLPAVQFDYSKEVVRSARNTTREPGSARKEFNMEYVYGSVVYVGR